ncbi:MAG: hypothetical protein ACJA19_000250 [Bacteroidia bacterium]|jgi:hypothetical protein|tara:strand:- start:315 stop:467 length:153 start_codon:yes stop_codon:yes gene_type:complete
MSKTEGGLSAIEIRSFKEVIERCGAKKVFISQNENTLGIHEALKALKSVT